MHISESKKENVLKNCKDGLYKEFGKYKIQRVDDLDGYKFFFDENTWMMIRASGTEPLLRIYAEASTQDIANDILKEVKQILLN
jgi:phosphomannomutase